MNDMKDIAAWHKEQNERDGTNYPLVRLFNSDGTLSQRVPVALVGEKDGEPKQALYVERVGELLFAGCDPEATAFARRDIDALAAVLYWQGYRALHCKVPRETAKSVSKPLIRAGFRCVDDEFSHFFKDLEANL
jgi:hypothetical protein